MTAGYSSARYYYHAAKEKELDCCWNYLAFKNHQTAISRLKLRTSISVDSIEDSLVKCSDVTVFVKNNSRSDWTYLTGGRERIMVLRAMVPV